MTTMPSARPIIAGHTHEFDLTRRGMIKMGGSAALGVVVGGSVLAGCSIGSESQPGSGGRPPAKPTGTLKVANNAEPVTLDPTLATNIADVGILMHNVYESLLQYDREGSRLLPLLATSFTSSDDARLWTFRLRSGVKFHDGEPLTSSAVRASFEYAKSSGGAYGYFLPDDATYDDSDPAVLRVRTNSPFPDLAQNVSIQKIISPKLLAAGPDRIKKNPTGTGPFRFVSYATAKSVVLEANPDYWAVDGGPYLKRIEFLIIPDADSRVAALRSGSVDLVLKLTPENANSLKSDPRIELTENPSWTTSKLFLYTDTPPMDNVYLRQAISCAIDRKALISSILDGVGGTPSDSWTVPGIYGSTEPKAAWDYDPDRARQLLAQSGLTTPVDVSMAYSTDFGGPVEQTSQAIAGMLKKVGINMRVLAKPGSELGKVHTSTTGAPRPWQAMLGGRTYMTGSAAHCIALQCLQREDQLSDARFEQLGETVLHTPNGGKRLELFAQIEQRVAELVPLITLYTEVAIHAHRTNVAGFVPPKDGLQPDYRSVFLA